MYYCRRCAVSLWGADCQLTLMTVNVSLALVAYPAI